MKCAAVHLRSSQLAVLPGIESVIVYLAGPAGDCQYIQNQRGGKKIKGEAHSLCLLVVAHVIHHPGFVHQSIPDDGVDDFEKLAASRPHPQEQGQTGDEQGPENWGQASVQITGYRISDHYRSGQDQEQHPGGQETGRQLSP